MKKQKLNEEDDDDDFEEEDIITTPREFHGSTPDPEEDYGPVWEKYLQQIDETEGFDIKDYPDSWMASIWPMTNYLNNPKNVHMLTDYARAALKEYNDKEGTKHEVKDILKVNGAGCRDFIFYITLTVTTSDGALKYFQVKAVRHLDMSLDFPTVRPRAKGDVDLW